MSRTIIDSRAWRARAKSSSAGNEHCPRKSSSKNWDSILRFTSPERPPALPCAEPTLPGACSRSQKRADLAAYLGVVLLTDGGDDQIEATALPKAPLYLVGMGTEPSTWNDLAITDAQCPAAAEKDVDFEITVELRARAGHSLGFAEKAAHARLRLERAAGSNTWETVLERPLEFSNLQARARWPVKCAQIGLQHYRLTALTLPGELSALNNSRPLTVNVQKQSLRVLYFTRALGQEFKVLRSELGRNPGISFTALFRTTGARFTLQGDRPPGDDAMAAGLPSSKQGLEAYDAIIIGSLPAQDCTPRQMQALIEFVEEGGALIFLGGEQSFGRGGYAQTSLAPLFLGGSPMPNPNRPTKPSASACRLWARGIPSWRPSKTSWGGPAPRSMR